MSMSPEQIKNIIEAALLSAGQPLSVDKLLSLFTDKPQPGREQVREALKTLQAECENRGVELKEVGSGFRYQARQEFAPWVGRLWEERPARYSRALLETLALIAYRQPITRGEIEDVRGVAVSTNIMKTLLEREWVKVVGHRDVPGRPAMYATTRQFLDYFDIKSLSDLPSLAELRDIENINAELDLGEPDILANEPSASEEPSAGEEPSASEEPSAGEESSARGETQDAAAGMDDVQEVYAAGERDELSGSTDVTEPDAVSSIDRV